MNLEPEFARIAEQSLGPKWREHLEKIMPVMVKHAEDDACHREAYTFTLGPHYLFRLNLVVMRVTCTECNRQTRYVFSMHGGSFNRRATEALRGI